MNIKRKLSFAIITLGITVSAVGCSLAPTAPIASSPTASVSATPDATVATKSSDSQISAAVRTKVDTPAVAESAGTTVTPTPVNNSPAAVQEAPPATPANAAPEEAPPVAQAPVAAAPVQAAPPAAPAPVVETPVVEAAPAVSREVYVGLAGGQHEVDLQQGPVLYQLGGGFPPYVAEHDIAGGWDRFGTLSAGMTVRMSGLVTGTYTVGQIINVPKHSTTNEFHKFSVMPKVMLQTCVPGTNRMIIVGLY
jgi:hypothetical protein